MRVSDILKTKGARVPSVRMHETLEVAARLLRREDIGALVVKDVCGTEGDVVLGVVSERDIARAVAAQGPAALKKPVSAVMSGRLVCCGPEDSLQRARELLEKHELGHLPVIDGHTLIGVVATQDLMAEDGGASRRAM